MAKVLSDGLIIAHTMVTSSTIISKGLEFTIGAIKGCIKVNGKTTRWKVQDYSRGPMAEFTKASIVMTRRKVRVYSHGLTDESTRGIGLMENKTGLEHTQPTQANNEWASGRMVSELHGSEYF